jgi:hypothetical protein
LHEYVVLDIEDIKKSQKHLCFQCFCNYSKYVLVKNHVINIFAVYRYQ